MVTNLRIFEGEKPERTDHEYQGFFGTKKFNKDLLAHNQAVNKEIQEFNDFRNSTKHRADFLREYIETFFEQTPQELEALNKLARLVEIYKIKRKKYNKKYNTYFGSKEYQVWDADQQEFILTQDEYTASCNLIKQHDEQRIEANNKSSKRLDMLKQAEKLLREAEQLSEHKQQSIIKASLKFCRREIVMLNMNYEATAALIEKSGVLCPDFLDEKLSEKAREYQTAAQ